MAGIYLHIPFCRHRCVYCDFFSSTDQSLRADYIKALCRELELRRPYLGRAKVDTIYVGGGTPSQLSVGELEQIFSYIYKVYKVSDGAEITLEANPDDLSDRYVADVRAVLPVNRISMGVQTFSDERLRLLRRRHNSAAAIRAVQRCRRAGIENISIDLIYGLPGETLDEWKSDLRCALSLHVPHLSAYHLTYEEGTPLWQMRAKGEVSEVSEETSVEMYARLVSMLEDAGYEHYEISNFCLPGMESRHNSSYWRRVPYLGCGAAAHSYDGVSRQWNVASVGRYIRGVMEGSMEVEREELDAATRYNDYVVTALRTSWGMSMPVVKKEFGLAFYEYCMRFARSYIERGLLELEGRVLRLTRKGVLLSDGVISDLLWVE
ncbi:MAG: radical SAM family heme chaperone HemW [Bacteroidaceae bacterium]|nr:radical SAM family heme chaperone HemW [Bacteroidaceae bacterium]